MNDVQHAPPAAQGTPAPALRSRARKLAPVEGPEALTAWAANARNLVAAIRDFAVDATAIDQERVYARLYLRKMMLRRMRDLDAQIEAVAAPRDDAAE